MIPALALILLAVTMMRPRIEPAYPETEEAGALGRGPIAADGQSRASDATQPECAPAARKLSRADSSDSSSLAEHGNGAIAHDDPADPRHHLCRGCGDRPHPCAAPPCFSRRARNPRYVRYLGHALPGAIFGLLVVYCLKDVNLLSGSRGIPEAVGIVVAAVLYKRWHNMLISIFASTAVYMVLVNLVF